MGKVSLDHINQVIREGPYEDNWQSLWEYDLPKWFKNAKFGLFSHFGLYSVAAYGNEWYAMYMYNPETDVYKHHKQTYGNPKDFPYEKFIDLFSCPKFDAKEWANIIESSGAKYYIPVAEHHDGFQMYNSQLSSFNSYEKGPKIDFINELKEALEINVGVSSHRAEHYFFMSGASKIFQRELNKSDIEWPGRDVSCLKKCPKLTKDFLEDWLLRCCELVCLFEPPIFYFDWWIDTEEFKPYLKKFLAFYYNYMLKATGSIGIVNYKHDAMPYNSGVREIERAQFETIQPDSWQSCTSISNNAWCHIENSQDKDAKEIIQTLIDTVSKNGNLLLNFCPHPDGYIKENEKKILAQLGDWLKINGEAIYESKPYKIYGEGLTNTNNEFFSEKKLTYNSSDFRFTINANKLYIFIMEPKSQLKYYINEFGEEGKTFCGSNYISSVRCLDDQNNVKFSREKESLILEIDKVSTLPLCIEIVVK